MLSKAAIDLILMSEGLNQPSKWPSGDSGITIGFGYDLGYVTRSQFSSDWKGVLSPAVFSRLASALGMKGQMAKALAPSFKDVFIGREIALKVFHEKTVPLWVEKTRRAFPGVENLPPDAQGALVSLVYNRGPALKGKNRKEMQEIHDILADGVQKGDLKLIAKQIREMKKIWQGKNLDGLIKRRELEAQLVECSIPLEKEHETKIYG